MNRFETAVLELYSAILKHQSRPEHIRVRPWRRIGARTSREIAKLYAAGMSTYQIAAHLGIRQSVVHYHVKAS